MLTNALLAVAALATREGISRKKASFGYYLDEHEHPRISKSDQHYEGKGMEFVWGMDELSIDELNELFMRVICMSPPSRHPCLQRYANALYSCDGTGLQNTASAGHKGRDLLERRLKRRLS